MSSFENQNQVAKKQSKGSRPVIPVKGQKGYQLAVWVSRNSLKIRVSRPTGNRDKPFEEVDTFIIPFEVWFTRVMFDSEVIDITKKYCKVADIWASEVVVEEDVEEE